jgi:hypothetical protein
VSLFRPDRIHLGLAPEGASFVLLGAGRRPIVHAQAHVPARLDSRTTQSDLGLVFDSLATARRKARDVHIVLADSLVRYFVVDAPKGLRSAKELEGIVHARFEEQFGLALGEWQIQADLEPGASGYLACAVPRLLSEGLRAECSARKLRLHSLVPYAICEMNRWQARLPRSEFWFAAVGSESLILAHRNRKGWRGIRSHARPQALDVDLVAMLERDSLRLGIVEARAAAIHCTGLVSQPVAGGASEVIKRLGAGLWPGQNEAWSQAHRLALSGVWP